MKIRDEIQETPNKPHGEAFRDKMKEVYGVVMAATHYLYYVNIHQTQSSHSHITFIVSNLQS